MNDIGDSLDVMRSDAVYGVALADSNVYNGGYQTPRGVDVKIVQEAKNSLLTEIRAMGASVVALPIGTSLLMGTYRTMTDGDLILQAFHITKTEPVTGVRFIQRTQGAYTAADYNGFALYSVSGTTLTKITETANNGDLWKGTGYTLQTAAFPSVQILTPGIYYVAAVYNQSAETSAPSVYSFNTIGAIHQLVTGGLRISGTLSSQASLPATISNNSVSSGDHIFGIWLY
jgi:hypothetical protein